MSLAMPATNGQIKTDGVTSRISYVFTRILQYKIATIYPSVTTLELTVSEVRYQ